MCKMFKQYIFGFLLSMPVHFWHPWWALVFSWPNESNIFHLPDHLCHSLIPIPDSFCLFWTHWGSDIKHQIPSNTSWPLLRVLKTLWIPALSDGGLCLIYLSWSWGCYCTCWAHLSLSGRQEKKKLNFHLHPNFWQIPKILLLNASVFRLRS